MGSSVSKNVSSIVTNAISKISSDIVQNSRVSTDSTQVISVSDITGNVSIDGNVSSQTATLNMNALFEALSSSENQQKILFEVAQQSKSLTKDLNLVQYADSNNTISTMVNATASILSTISQTCKIFSTQTQEINIERVVGNVNITNNIQDQITRIFSQCTEKAVSENKQLQDVVSSLNQTATSTTEGLSAWALAGIVAAVLGIPIIGASVALPKILKFLFPLILLTGVIFIVLYTTKTKEEMKLTAYSTFIKTSCQTQLLSTDASNEFEAQQKCQNDPKCKGFDWKIYDVQPDGLISFSPAFAQYYSDIQPPDCTVAQDRANIVSPIQTSKGIGMPTPTTPGDVYLHTGTGIWYQRNEKWPTLWQPMGSFTTSTFSNIDWGFSDPPSAVQTNIVTDIDTLPFANDSVYVQISRLLDTFTVYRLNGVSWIEERKSKGPGIKINAPKQTNTSGIKTVTKPTWMLYTGIGAITLGIFGMFIERGLKKEKYTLQECSAFPFKF